MAATTGPDVIPFLYLGAKHMVTGYDHLLFLLGVIFFLYRMKDVALYVTLFSIGHSITLLAGVLVQIEVNPYLVDAVIGLSVAYKAFDNLGGFRTLFGVQPDTAGRGARLRPDPRLRPGHQAAGAGPHRRTGCSSTCCRSTSGVEIGQMIALTFMLALIMVWRTLPGYRRMSTAANVLLMLAGFVLIGFQLGGLVYGEPA